MAKRRVIYNDGDLKVGDTIRFRFEGIRYGVIERINQARQRLELRSCGKLFGINKKALEYDSPCPEAYEI